MSVVLLDKKIEALRAFKNGIFDAVADELKENQHIILDMNTVAQLYELGINSKSISLDSFAPYTSKTISIKVAKNQPTDRVTLKDTGDFYSSFRMVFYDDGFIIESTDSKAKELIGKYGEDILGLTDENIQEIISSYLMSAVIKLRDTLL